VKDVSIDGYLGGEFQYANRSSSDRFYCVNGRFYTFSSRWPSTQPCPAAITRIVNSFRLLNAEPRKNKLRLQSRCDLTIKTLGCLVGCPINNLT
jgi:hypothetical protein